MRSSDKAPAVTDNTIVPVARLIIGLYSSLGVDMITHPLFACFLYTVSKSFHPLKLMHERIFVTADHTI